ncbi:MAG TPA: hypothetical protein GXX20_01010 [Clostridiaceae bacterium]|nr:hypothetical protein [Clostridiaceae bacterium]
MLINPYNIQGEWYKGNLHTHTSNSKCGHYSVEKVIELYTSCEIEYDFLAITDHCNLTELADYFDDKKIILFQGVEYKRKKFQTLGINISKYYDTLEDNEANTQEIIQEVNSQGGISIICHPHMLWDDYWPVEMLNKLSGYKGIEIFNNNVKMNNAGRALATDVWDYLLSKGKKIAGFANDDMHIFNRTGGAFNMVLAAERSRYCIMDGIINDRFYASTGIIIDSIEVAEKAIYIKTSLPVIFRFIGKGPVILKEQFGTEAHYICKDNEPYVRVEMIREDGAMAWTQPFYNTMAVKF